MKREWFTIGFHLGYRYDASPIVWPDGTPAPPLETSTYTQTGAAGGAGAARLAAGRALDPRPVRPRLHLAAAGRRSTGGERLRAAAAAAGVPLDVVDLDAPEVAARSIAPARPDSPTWTVAWRADAEPQDARAVIDVVRGARRYANMTQERDAADGATQTKA